MSPGKAGGLEVREADAAGYEAARKGQANSKRSSCGAVMGDSQNLPRLLQFS